MVVFCLCFSFRFHLYRCTQKQIDIVVVVIVVGVGRFVLLKFLCQHKNSVHKSEKKLFEMCPRERIMRTLGCPSGFRCQDESISWALDIVFVYRLHRRRCRRHCHSNVNMNVNGNTLFTQRVPKTSLKCFTNSFSEKKERKTRTKM